MLRSALKHAFTRFGYVYYKKSFLPKGVDWVWDIARLSRLTVPVSVVFDIGANEGQTSNRLVGEFPGAEIHAFEPSGQTFEVLLRRMASFPKVHSHQLALGDSEGRKLLLVRPDWTGLNRIIDDTVADTSATTESVRITTVDAFCGREQISQIDVLKTDTEGYDLQVLRGCSRMLGGVKYVVSEITFDDNDHAHSQFTELNGLLSAAGFGLYALYHYEHREDRSLLYCDALWCKR